MIYQKKVVLITILIISIISILGLPYTNWWLNGDDFHALYLASKIKTWKALFYFFYDGHVNQDFGPSNFPRGGRTSFLATYYRPLYFFYHVIQYWLFGTNGYWYLLTNVVVHAANSALLFYIGSLFAPLSAAFLGACAFAFHPQIAYRFGHLVNLQYYINVLCMLCIFLLGKQYLDTRKHRYYLLACVLFVCALFTRETLVVLPFILMLWAAWYTEALLNPMPVFKKDARGWFVLRDGSYEPPQDERDNFKYPEDPEQALLVEGHERNKALTLSPVEGVEPFERTTLVKLTSPFWAITIAYVALRTWLYPFDFASLGKTRQAAPLLTIIMNKLQQAIVFCYDALWLSWLPWGNTWLRLGMTLPLTLIIIIAFITTTQKIPVLLCLVSTALIIWPAYVGAYSPRYFYEVAPFIVMAYLACFVFSSIKSRIYRRAVFLYFTALIVFCVYFCVECFTLRTQKMHVLHRAMDQLVLAEPSRPICFLSHPLDGFGDLVYDAFWVMHDRPRLIYCDGSAALTQRDSNIVSPIGFRNKISQYHDKNYVTIVPVDGGFRYTSSDPSKVQFFLPPANPWSLGSYENVQYEPINGQSIITGFTLRLDTQYAKQRPLFLVWDWKKQMFKELIAP